MAESKKELKSLLMAKVESEKDGLKLRWDGEGGGSWDRMGNTCTPMADSCQCMAKITIIL